MHCKLVASIYVLVLISFSLDALHPESQEHNELEFARHLSSCEDEEVTSSELAPRQLQVEQQDVERESEGGEVDSHVADNYGTGK